MPYLTKAAWVFLLLFFSSAGYTQQVPGYNIYLTNKFIDGKPDNQPMTRFDCSDRIYLVVTVVGLSEESHELKVRWLDPRENQKELTRYNFTAVTITQIWAWLQLHGPSGAIIGQMFDPSFGMEQFIGEWKAEVMVDGERVATPVFQVLC